MPARSLPYVLLFLSLCSGTAGAWGAPVPGDKLEDKLVDKIVNGQADSLHPTVGLLQSNGGACTATLIGCQTVLTAAHCICTLPTGTVLDGRSCQARADLLDPTNKTVFFQHAGTFAVASVGVNPAFIPNAQADVAVLHLASRIANVAPSPINTAGKPALGTPGEIVGFGVTQGRLSDYGLKRSGAVTVATCSGGDSTQVCWSFRDPPGAPGTNSNTCNGDSGGPLFTSVGGRMVVSGVTSWGNLSCKAPDSAHDADVFRERVWIQSESGSDLGGASCGAGPQVGGSGTTVLGGAGSLTAADPQDTYTLEVPVGTAQLRVSANAVQFDRNALSLYAKQGAPASPASFDCKAEATVGLAYCEVRNPAPGTWHLLVARRAGDPGGAYQMTATLIAQDGPTGPCVADATTLCLQNGRFRVTATYQTPDGQIGPAKGVKLTEESGYLWFFADTNVEAVVKVLDACAFNQRFWVYAGGLTNVQTTVLITDTTTGTTRTYENPQGSAFQPIQDSAAFATCR